MKLLLDSHTVIWSMDNPAKLSRQAVEAVEDAVVFLCASLLPVTITDADEQHRLPLHHRDPFDRMLVAQAKTGNLTIVSIDQVFDVYGVPRLW